MKNKKERLIVTSPTGCFMVNPETGNVKTVLEKGNTEGYFGIAYYEGKIVVAARTNLGTKKPAKSSTDTTLYSVDPGTLKASKVLDVYGLSDVHQIAVLNQYLLITDTWNNRLGVVNLDTQKFVCWLNIGKLRSDVNHINSVFVTNEKILLTLNNRGYTTDLLQLRTKDILTGIEKKSEKKLPGKILKLNKVSHSHDILPYGDDLLLSTSCHGYIYSFKNKRPKFFTSKAAHQKEGLNEFFRQMLYKVFKYLKFKVVPPRVKLSFNEEAQNSFVKRILMKIDWFFNLIPKVYEMVFLKDKGMFHKDVWSRGMDFTSHGLWVGFSPYAKRQERNSTKLVASVGLFSTKDFSLVKKIELPGASQVYDVRTVLK